MRSHRNGVFCLAEDDGRVFHLEDAAWLLLHEQEWGQQGDALLLGRSGRLRVKAHGCLAEALVF